MENKWFSTLSAVSDLLRDSGIRHVFIKNLVNPFEWGDIDVMIPYPSELMEARKLIVGEGFEPTTAGAYSPPLKTCLVKGKIVVELYPRAMWKRRAVADGREIVSRRVPFFADGVEFYTPSREDDFYLIATHACSHMRITEAEVENAKRLCSDDFDWGRVRGLAKRFGTSPWTYFFLKAMGADENMTDGLGFAGSSLVDAWFESRMTFPLQIPRFLGRILPLPHVIALARSGVRETVHGLISTLC